MNHPLSDPWTFYYILNDSERTEFNGLHKLGRVESIEQFWDLFHNMKRPSTIPKIEMGLFIRNFKLDKTDSVYKNGCILKIPIPEELLDVQWERLVMNAIGNNLDKDVVGISTKFSKKAVFLWCKNKFAMDFVEDNVVDLLGIDDDVKITRHSIQ